MAGESLQKTCPHCGAFLEPAAKVCPNCGALVKGDWPPPPGGFAPPAMPQPPKTLTGRVWADFLLGATVQYLLHLATARVLAANFRSRGNRDVWDQLSVALGFVLPEIVCAAVFGLILYYALRPFSPIMARGSGYMTILLLVMLLGAFFTCRPLLY